MSLLVLDNNPNPSKEYLEITPSDTVSFSRLTRGIYVGTVGDIAVVKRDGSTVTFVGVPSGTILPVIALRINATDTTATNLIAFF